MARLAQRLTIAWMVVELGIALASGIAARSVALTAFGLDSGIEIFTASVVLHKLTNGDASEENASRLVGYGLYALIVYIVISSAVGLALHIRAEPSPIGIVLGFAAIVVMTGLWRWRLKLADEIGSPALRGDAACSVVCIWLSATMLIGLLLNQAFGWWWADSIAALALIWWIRSEAAEAMEAVAPPRLNPTEPLL
jgi:divalent metal cation (Fe/Co/Zn/Cd) transporter